MKDESLKKQKLENLETHQSETHQPLDPNPKQDVTETLTTMLLQPYEPNVGNYALPVTFLVAGVFCLAVALTFAKKA